MIALNYIFSRVKYIMNGYKNYNCANFNNYNTSLQPTNYYYTISGNVINGKDGQNVSLNILPLITLYPNQVSYLVDTVTTSNNTQYHNLTFLLARAQNNYFSIGSVTTLPYGSTPTITMTNYYDSSGDVHWVQNYSLITGPTGPKGDQGPQGNDTTAALAGAISGAATGFIAGLFGSYINNSITSIFGSLFDSITGQANQLTSTQTLEAQLAALFEEVNTLEADVTYLQQQCYYIVTNTTAASTKLVGCDFYVNESGGNAHIYNGTLALDNNLYCNNGTATNSFTTANLSTTSINNSNNINSNYVTCQDLQTTKLTVTGAGTTQLNGDLFVLGNISCIGNVSIQSNETVTGDVTVNGLLTTRQLAVLQDQVLGVENQEIRFHADYNSIVAGFGQIY